MTDKTDKTDKKPGNPNFQKRKLDDSIPALKDIPAGEAPRQAEASEAAPAPEPSIQQLAAQSQTTVELGADLSPKEDFFYVPQKDPDHHYHWAENKPRRVHEMKRMGYEVDPSVSSSEAARKVGSQIAFLEKQLGNPNISEVDAMAAKSMIEQLKVTPIDTATNIPESVLMRTSQENWTKRENAKHAVLDSMQDKIDETLDAVDKSLKRGGHGGIQQLTDFFKEVVEKNRQR